MVYSKRYMGASKNQLSDRDMLLDLLMTEKYISQVYNTAIMEATNSDVLDTFEEMQHDEHENGRLLFTAMQERGWYNANQTEKSNERPLTTKFTNKTNSSFAVTSGAKNFGNRLGIRRSNGINTNARRHEGSPTNYDLQ